MRVIGLRAKRPMVPVSRNPAHSPPCDSGLVRLRYHRVPHRPPGWAYGPAGVSSNREHDERTGRPRVGPFEAIATLTDRELEQELLTAAVAPDHRRFDRFARLLRERDRRSRREDIVLVVATGLPDARALFAGELARLLGAAYLEEVAVWGALPTETARPATTVAAVLVALAEAHLRARISVVLDGEGGTELEDALRTLHLVRPDVPIVRVTASSGDGSAARIADEVWDRARRDGDG